MNANDIQTLHDKYCAFTGIPVTDSKLFYIEYTGMGDLFEGAYNKGIKVKGLEFTYRHGDLWITTLYEHRFEQRKFPKNTLEGNCPEFICSWDGNSNIMNIGSCSHLLILLDLRNGRHHMTLQNPINVHFRPMGGNFTWNSGADTQFLPRIDLERTCRTWAVSGDLGLELMQNITGEGTRHAPYTAIIHGRASNIGVSYYDDNGGDFVETKALAQRYGSKYIGRTTSWDEVSDTRSFLLNEGHSVWHSRRRMKSMKIMEFHFPRNDIETANAEYDIFGNADKKQACGYSLIYENGEMERYLFMAPFKRGHPLNESLPKTRFKEIYIPEQLPVDYWTWVSEVIQGDDELNKEEKEMVGKWFTGYITNMIRKGKQPSDEEIEFAKRLGVYKGE